jgi:glycosyltransferase involved in cell wall biosynthesis
MKIAVLFNQFGPYHYARLNALGKRAQTYGIEFFSKSDTYKWDSSGLANNISFIKKTLFDVEDPSTISKDLLKKELFEILNEISPDCVAINGWSESGAFVALKWCLLNKKHAIAMSASTEFDTRRFLIKEAIKKRIVRKFSAAVVGGSPHKEYMHKLGLKRSHIFDKYDVVDNDYFLSAARNIRANPGLYQERLSLPQNYFLASARFVQKKNLERLIKAFSIYESKRQNQAWSLVLIGDGELQPLIIKLIEDLKIQEKVVMPGFKQYNELPYYYALAKVFIHASTSEQWGLVVNEAMASALPVLISDRCGCAQDLVKPGVNGLIFDPFSVEDIAEKMLLISSEKNNLNQMSSESLEIISDYTPDSFAKNLILAAEKALGSKKSFNTIDNILIRFLIKK